MVKLLVALARLPVRCPYFTRLPPVEVICLLRQPELSYLFLPLPRPVVLFFQQTFSGSLPNNNSYLDHQFNIHPKVRTLIPVVSSYPRIPELLPSLPPGCSRA